MKNSQLTKDILKLMIKMVNKKIVAHKLLAYLQHNLSLEDLVDWAETAYMEGDFEQDDAQILTDILGKIGLADTENFGLLWSDCEYMMSKLGYNIQVLASAA